MSLYNPANHYWIIGGSTTQVYSSATNTLVAIDNAQYLAWRADLDNKPTPIATQAQVWDVLWQQNPAALPPAERTARLYTAAKGLLTADDPISKTEKALLLTILAEFNLHAAKINALFDAIDAAVTLAALKTAVLAIPNYPTRTVAQLRTSISNAIDAGQADG